MALKCFSKLFRCGTGIVVMTRQLCAKWYVSKSLDREYLKTKEGLVRLRRKLVDEM